MRARSAAGGYEPSGLSVKRVAPGTASRPQPPRRSQRPVAAAGADPAPAWIFVDGSRTERRFRRALAEQGIAAERTTPGRFVVYQPERRVVPEEFPPETFER